MDRATGDYRVSIWADPDVGEGTFYIALEPATRRTLSSPVKVEVAIQPVSKRLPEKRYPAERRAKDTFSYFAKVPFDKQEMWRVRVLFHGTGGVQEIATQVEATPDDLGPFGMIFYLLPFLAIGFIWIKVVLTSRRQRLATPQPSH